MILERSYFRGYSFITFDNKVEVGTLSRSFYKRPKSLTGITLGALRLSLKRLCVL